MAEDLRGLVGILVHSAGAGGGYARHPHTEVALLSPAGGPGVANDEVAVVCSGAIVVADSNHGVVDPISTVHTQGGVVDSARVIHEGVLSIKVDHDGRNGNGIHERLAWFEGRGQEAEVSKGKVSEV